ncbi:hypothetical protein MCELHM10_02431 [Paracoccaceae bacterium]
MFGPIYSKKISLRPARTEVHLSPNNPLTPTANPLIFLLLKNLSTVDSAKQNPGH